MQNSAGTILQFELYPPLFTYRLTLSSILVATWT